MRGFWRARRAGARHRTALSSAATFGSRDSAVTGAAWGVANRAASATAADTVVDSIVLPLYGAVKRRRGRRLRNAGAWDGLAGRRQIIPIEKMSRRRFAEFRRDVPAVVL